MAADKLTDTAIRQAKPGQRPDGTATAKSYALTDGAGLYLEILPTGGKYWRWKYRHAGKQKRLALGVYPRVTLKQARQLRADGLALLDHGVDPLFFRKATKHQVAEADSFEAIAREWHAKFAPTWTAQHAARIITPLELNVFPWIGARPVGEITATGSDWSQSRRAPPR